MSYVELLYAAPNDLKKMFRDLEKIKKKLINNIWSVRFNSICIKENIMPNYSYFKLHDQAATNLESTINFRWQLVERQIEEKEQLIQAKFLHLTFVQRQKCHISNYYPLPAKKPSRTN